MQPRTPDKVDSGGERQQQEDGQDEKMEGRIKSRMVGKILRLSFRHPKSPDEVDDSSLAHEFIPQPRNGQNQLRLLRVVFRLSAADFP
jgi:hypothetical protein